MKKNMRILIIGDKKRFFHLKQFAKQLEKKNLDVEIIYDLDFIDRFLEINIREKIAKKHNFEEILTRFKPDIVLLDRISKIGRKIIEKNIPLFILLRGNYWEEVSWAKKTIYKSKIDKLRVREDEKNFNYCLENASLILPISTYLEKIAKEKFPSKKIKILAADGRNSEEWKNIAGMKLKHPSIGLLQGFNIWGKTKELLILKNVMKELPDFTFYLAGDGAYSDKIIPELEKFENFSWLRNLDYPNKVKQFLSEIDIFLLLSGLEGLGQSIIEASLMKKPMIASDVGGIRDLIQDGINGFLVKEGDSEKIVEIIKKYSNDPELTKKIAENAYSSIREEFDWKSISEKFLKILQEEKFVKN